MADTSLLTSILNRRGEQYGHFVLEACLEKTTGGYDNLFAKLTAIKAGENKPINETLDFESYVLTARYLDIYEIKQILEKQNPTFTIGRYSFTMNNAHLGKTYHPERISSNNNWSQWPADLLELRCTGGSNYIPPKILISHNTPRIFRDVFDGIQQYMGENISNHSGWLRAVLFVLPDYRIRIREIVSNQDKITIKLYKDGALNDVRVQCLIKETNGRQEISEPVKDSEISLSLNSEIGQIESFQVFITTPEGTIDYYQQNSLHHSGQIRWLTGSRQSLNDNAALLLEIQNGEGVNLEFKPYVHPGKGEEKASELIRTAIAFANTGGGSILFGVSDTGEIDGIEKHLRKNKEGPHLASAAEKYGSQVKVLLNDAIATSARLVIRAYVIELAGHILLRIDIQELPFENKPAWKLDSKDTWIRRGSTNFKADPDLIRTGFSKAKNTWPTTD